MGMAKQRSPKLILEAEPFAGFPADAFVFFDDLEESNSREWFLANRHRYDSSVRGPIERFLAGVEKEFGEAHVFRPNRDTRFSADKTPYKTNIGATLGGRNPAHGTFYVHLDQAGLMAATGFYGMATDQILRMRAAIHDETTGPALASIVSKLIKSGYTIGEPALKRVPPGFDKEHPRGELLRFKSMVAYKNFGQPDWLATPRAADHIVKTWRAGAALNEWLHRNVGPSEKPPIEK
jgi:uncharacterized protein (TIGR02453 family)